MSPDEGGKGGSRGTPSGDDGGLPQKKHYWRLSDRNRAIFWCLRIRTGPKKGQIEVPGGQFICATNKTSEYTNGKWSFCSVYPCIHATKTPFLQTGYIKSFVYLCICVLE